MRFSSWFGPTAAQFTSIAQVWVIATHLVPSAQAINFTPIPTPSLDLSGLGRVALTGNFDAISLYTFHQQNENSFSTNGSQSLLSQLPNGAFASLDSADASIMTMCPFVMQDGTLAGVVVGGNFTSLGGIQAQGIAMVDPTTGKITPLPGLSGQVNAVLCDQAANTVYVGGNFKGANSTNAIAWVGTAGWTNLPFAGFNGPVTSIAIAPDGNVIFGGTFDGLGNTTTPSKPDQQIINLSSATISAEQSNSSNGFSNPSNIVCKTSGQNGPGNTWLLADNSSGSWSANMSFGYEPTKLRLWNTRQDGRGTKTFRFTALPINGIMNLTFVDPNTGQNTTCDSQCPLSNNQSVQFQDFHFINVIGMNAFRIDISDWYGDGAGLDGIELFQNDIFAYAINDFNEPACANIPLGSNSSSTGPWSETPSGLSTSSYLTANVTASDGNASSTSVIFKPDIKQSGNYSVQIYTPGCKQDGTCTTRGIVNVTGTFASGTESATSLPTQIFQTNDFDKYDEIYSGFVDSNTNSFRPTVTLTPSANQNGNITLVAQRVRFQLLNSTGGLNGLFEYNSSQATVDSDFSNSIFDQAGMTLNTGAVVNSLAVIGSTTFVAGNFSGDGIENIFSVSTGNATSLPGGGLDAEIFSTYVDGTVLYVGGNFSKTTNNSVAGLSNLAAFDTNKQTWQPLGAGVNGRVLTIVPLLLNISNGQPETCITLNGNFNQILASNLGDPIAVEGLAVWVPSQNNWLQNLNLQTMAISGQLSAATNVSGSSPLLAGTISSQGMAINDAVALSNSGGSLSLDSLGLQIQPQQSGFSNKKRAVAGQNSFGVVTGLFYNNGGLDLTILGGHFAANAADGSTINNIAFVNNTDNGKGVSSIGSGVDPDSSFLALATQDTTLYAGGTVTGQVNGATVDGLILYDLASNAFSSPQPPALAGDSVLVNAISVRPSSTEVYVGGSFDAAGSLGCPSICVFNNQQWNRPGSGLAGNVSTLLWQNNDQLLVGGNLTVSSNATSLATYDAKTGQWAVVNGANTGIPGPVTALAPSIADRSQYWVAGKSLNNSAFLIKYDGANFQPVSEDLGNETTILGLSMLDLSVNHAANNLVDPTMTLLITGQLNLPSFGNASAALFNGTTFSPFILSTSGNGPGSLSQIFTEKTVVFATSGGHLALGLVVLISLACAAGVTFLIIVAGFIWERLRRRREGYVAAPTAVTAIYDKTSNIDRIPPESLFSSLGRGGRGPPRI